jgi:uncharacterized protein YjiS (DUF1127 family)
MLIGIVNRCERSCQRRQRLDLNDHLLADIGITREQAREQAGKSFWIRLNMDAHR